MTHSHLFDECRGFPHGTLKCPGTVKSSGMVISECECECHMHVQTFKSFANQVYNDCPMTLRAGQWAANLLRSQRPELEAKVFDRALDPFYDDSVLPRFMAYLQGEW